MPRRTMLANLWAMPSPEHAIQIKKEARLGAQNSSLVAAWAALRLCGENILSKFHHRGHSECTEARRNAKSAHWKGFIADCV